MKKLVLIAVFLGLAAGLILYIGVTKPEPQSLETQNKAPDLSPNENSDQAHAYLELNNSESIDFRGHFSDEWWASANVYEIWVRSFYDSDGDGNGDLNGIREKIPYLQSLGVDAVWLSPIFESPSYHGYDTTDYYRVNLDFGTNDDLKALARALEKAGIKLILDLVLNHVSELHPWFQRALAGEKGYDEYFVWADSRPNNQGVPWEDTPNPEAVWHKKPGDPRFYYGVFGWTQPDLNYQSPEVREEMLKVAEYWQSLGVDGFRLDAIRYLVEEGAVQSESEGTMAYIQEFAARAKKRNPEVLLIGEIVTESPTVAKYYLDGKGVDQAFDYRFVDTAKSLFHDVDPIENSEMFFDENAIAKAARDALWENLKARKLADGVPAQFFAPFINNHDVPRSPERGNDQKARAKILASLLLLAPGSVYLYYGEEIGLSQVARGFPYFQRTPMQWDESPLAGFTRSKQAWIDESEWFWWDKSHAPWWQENWESYEHRTNENAKHQQVNTNSIFQHYRTLLKLRDDTPAITRAEKITRLSSNGSAHVLVFEKKGQAIFVAINMNPSKPVTFSVPSTLRGTFPDLLENQNVSLTESLVLKPAQTLAVQIK